MQNEAIHRIVAKRNEELEHQAALAIAAEAYWLWSLEWDWSFLERTR